MLRYALRISSGDCIMNKSKDGEEIWIICDPVRGLKSPLDTVSCLTLPAELWAGSPVLSVSSSVRWLPVWAAGAATVCPLQCGAATWAFLSMFSACRLALNSASFFSIGAADRFLSSARLYISMISCAWLLERLKRIQNLTALCQYFMYIFNITQAYLHTLNVNFDILERF